MSGKTRVNSRGFAAGFKAIKNIRRHMKTTEKQHLNIYPLHGSAQMRSRATQAEGDQMLQRSSPQAAQVSNWQPRNACKLQRSSPQAAQVSTILVKAGFREAPPTRKPSMLGCFIRSPQFSGVALPPYWIRIAAATAGLTAVAKNPM